MSASVAKQRDDHVVSVWARSGSTRWCLLCFGPFRRWQRRLYEEEKAFHVRLLFSIRGKDNAQCRGEGFALNTIIHTPDSSSVKSSIALCGCSIRPDCARRPFRSSTCQCPWAGKVTESWPSVGLGRPKGESLSGSNDYRRGGVVFHVELADKFTSAFQWFAGSEVATIKPREVGAIPVDTNTLFC